MNRTLPLLFNVVLVFLLAACAADPKGLSTPIPKAAGVSSSTPTIHTSPTEATTTPIHLAACYPINSSDNQFLVIGYLPDYQELDPAWGSCLTDLIYFSAEPLENGQLDTSRLNPDTLQSLQSMKSNYGTRIHLSLGGWGRSGSFSQVASNRQTRQLFVENLSQFCLQNELDGIDLDWEFPKTETEIQGYAALITEIKKKGLLVSVALYPDDQIDFQPYLQADRIHVMSYNRGSNHASFEQAALDLDIFARQGFPAEKLVLGIPMYGLAAGDPYASLSYAGIINKYQPDPYTDEIDGLSFNGISTVRDKTCFARGNGFGGIMFWELGQDTKDHTSLLVAANHAVFEPCPPQNE
ncbi:MAG: glycoside hydrolase family 18 protein [Anaerolineales bacterium]|nr:glycoside hydrolase family 18 protein [Anaerolineales bacterium]